MQVDIEKNTIEKLLITVQPFLEKKDLTQITSHIHFKAIENQLFIKATDYEIGIQINSNKCTIKDEGQATTNGKKILDIIKNLKDGNITLIAENEQLIIKQKTAKFEIPMYNPEDFPPFPKINDTTIIKINKQTFTNGIRKALPCIETNSPRYELSGVLIKFLDDHYDIVSTDTKRLAIINYQEHIEKELSLIIPKRSIIEIQKLIHQESELFIDSNHFIIKQDNVFLFTKLINAEYPAYEKIVPQNINHHLELPKEEVLKDIQMIAALGEIICIEINDDFIRYTTTAEAQSKAKVDMSFKTDIKAYKININSKYLIDFLNVTDSEKFTLHLGEENLPFMVSDDNFKTIIMPVIN